MIIDNLLQFIGISAGEITKQTVDASTKGVVDVAESIKKGTASAVSKLEGRVDSREPKRDKVTSRFLHVTFDVQHVSFVARLTHD